MENTTDSKNPMGESKAKGGVGNVLGLAILAFVVVFGGLVALGYFAYTQIQDSGKEIPVEGDISEDVSNDAFIENLRAQVADETLSFETRRDLQISIMLSVYSDVVEATADDVSWEEYIDALDAFIAEIDMLYSIDQNAQLKEGVDLFHEARETYVSSIHFDDPSAKVEAEGVEQASATIQEAQDIVNQYLDGLETVEE